MNPLDVFAENLVGVTVADRYAVERVLGVGGMGVVLGARHVVTGRRVALKLTPHASGDDAIVARFRVEAAALGALDHPNVVAVYDAGYDSSVSCLYVAQEWLDGRTLEAELEARGKLSWREAVVLLAPIARALAAAHAIGVIHRDAKPSNIILARKRDTLVPTLFDFGIAKDTNKQRLTATGASPGTPWYMAPEQISDDAPGAQADVWSVGAILFECIAGRPPFDGSNTTAVLAQVLSAPVPRLDNVTTSCPRAVADLVARCLTRDREQRFATMSLLVEALRSLLVDDVEEYDDEPTVLATSHQTTLPDLPVRKSRPSWRIGTISLALTLAVAVMLTSTARTADPHPGHAPMTAAMPPTKSLPGKVTALNRVATSSVEPITVAVPIVHAQDVIVIVRRPVLARLRTRPIVSDASVHRPAIAESPNRNGAPVFEP